MKKAALTIKAMIGIIMVIAVLVILILFLSRINTGALKMVEDSDCKSSILAHIALVRMTGEAIVPDIYCPTKYYTLPGSKSDETKQYVADALKTCWGTWGQGQYQLFNNEGYYCHVCSVIDFKDKKNEINGLAEYLAVTPIKQGEELTYLDYLGFYASEDAKPEVIQKIKDMKMADSLKTSQTYSVIFVYAKGEKFIKKFLDSVDALGLGTAGGGITAGFGVGVAAGIGTGVLLATATAASAGTIWLVGGAVALASTVAGGVLGFNNANEIDWVSQVLIIEYNNATLNTLGCEISPAKQDKIQKALG